MTDDQVFEAIRSTFRPAEMIWGVSSPFLNASTWVGYTWTVEQSDYLDEIMGHVARPIPKGTPKHVQVAHLIRNILPKAGSTLFDSGYSGETLYVNPPPQPWTPSVLAITLGIDTDHAQTKFALFSVTCGTGPTPIT